MNGHMQEGCPSSLPIAEGRTQKGCTILTSTVTVFNSGQMTITDTLKKYLINPGPDTFWHNNKCLKRKQYCFRMN